MAISEVLETSTCCLEGSRSIQLSYETNGSGVRQSLEILSSLQHFEDLIVEFFKTELPIQITTDTCSIA